METTNVVQGKLTRPSGKMESYEFEIENSTLPGLRQAVLKLQTEIGTILTETIEASKVKGEPEMKKAKLS